MRHRTHDFDMQKNRPWGDAVVTGHGTIDGRRVCVFSQDFTVFGGSLGEVMGEKMCKIMDLAAKIGCPVIGINDSGGARIQEGVVSLGAYGDVFVRNVQCSGVIPQISLIMGPCAGGAVYSPAITDFIFMVKETSHMFITGPDVIKTVTGEEVDFEELGGAMTPQLEVGRRPLRRRRRGRLPRGHPLPHVASCPQNNLEIAAARRADRRPEPAWTPSSTRSSPTTPTSPTTCATSCAWSSTTASSSRSTSTARTNIICGFARLDGFAVGVVGNQPAPARRRARHRLLGQGRALRAHLRRLQHPADHLHRRARLPARHRQEWGGIIRHGAKLLYAYTEATVPKITVITRKAYGGAYDVMASKHMLADFNFAWPQAEVAVMGPEGAVNIIYRRDIAAVADARRAAPEAHGRLQGALRQPLHARPSAATSTT